MAEKTLIEEIFPNSFAAMKTSDSQTVESLKHQFVLVPRIAKDLYLLHILSKMKDMGFRSAIVFVSSCRICHLLSFLLEELDHSAAALNSFKSQTPRLSALHRFKSGQVPVLLAKDVACRGLDIPTVDLVINYDIPSYPQDYVHRVRHTTRAGRGGLAVSLVTQDDLNLVHEIEAVIGKQLQKYECNDNEVLVEFNKVDKAKQISRKKMMDKYVIFKMKSKRISTIKMMGDGLEEKAKARTSQMLKALQEKRPLKRRSRKRNTMQVERLTSELEKLMRSS